MRTVLFLLFSIYIFNVVAQESKPKDLIKFKDGSEYRGRIVEYLENQKLIIEVAGNPITIVGEHFENIKEIGFDKLRYKNKTRGLWYELNLGLTVGKSNDNGSAEAYPSILAVTGYQFNRFAGVGFGTGYQSHSLVNIVPFYATFRGDILDSRVTPFYYLDAGYGFGYQKSDDTYFNNKVKVKGGLLFGPGGGVRFKMKKMYFTASLGYKLQKSQVKRINFYDWRWGFTSNNVTISGSDPSSTEKRLYKRAEIRIGIGF